MNLTELVNRIRTRLGLNNDFIFTNMDPYKMVKHIQEFTIPRFSELNQHSLVANISFIDDDIISVRRQSDLLCGAVVTKLPKELLELKERGFEIFSVCKMAETRRGNRPNNWFYPHKRYASHLSESRAAHNAQQRNRELSVARVKLINENFLEIENTTREELIMCRFDITILVSHTTNLSTINGNLSHVFESFCTYDIGRTIYSNEFKYLDQTEIGTLTIDLKIDEIRECDNKYEELVREIKSARGLDMFQSHLLV